MGWVPGSCGFDNFVYFLFMFRGLFVNDHLSIFDNKMRCERQMIPRYLAFSSAITESSQMDAENFVLHSEQAFSNGRSSGNGFAHQRFSFVSTEALGVSAYVPISVECPGIRDGLDDFRHL